MDREDLYIALAVLGVPFLALVFTVIFRTLRRGSQTRNASNGGDGDGDGSDGGDGGD